MGTAKWKLMRSRNVNLLHLTDKNELDEYEMNPNKMQKQKIIF